MITLRNPHDIQIGDYILFETSYQYYTELSILEIISKSPKSFGFKLKGQERRRGFHGKTLTLYRNHKTIQGVVLKAEDLEKVLEMGAKEGDGFLGAGQ